MPNLLCKQVWYCSLISYITEWNAKFLCSNWLLYGLFLLIQVWEWRRWWCWHLWPDSVKNNPQETGHFTLIMGPYSLSGCDSARHDVIGRFNKHWSHFNSCISRWHINTTFNIIKSPKKQFHFYTLLSHELHLGALKMEAESCWIIIKLIIVKMGKKDSECNS